MKRILYISIMSIYCIPFIWFTVLVIYSGAIAALVAKILRLNTDPIVDVCGIIIWAAMEWPERICGIKL